jgi:DMSO reductase family type II enzyme chaperone
MNTNLAFRRAQVYNFLAHAFLYPLDNWTEDVPLVQHILNEIDPSTVWELAFEIWDLDSLQSEHRRTFGLTGSLCYETEMGLPHEFRQSQELADIAGFYRAFGFNVGGTVRERPDHLAVELEFMYVLALKEAQACHTTSQDHVDVCVDAQKKFLGDHLSKWAGVFAAALAQSAGEGPFTALAQLAANFVKADAARLGVTLAPRAVNEIQLTPFNPVTACEGCAVAEAVEQV